MAISVYILHNRDVFHVQPTMTTDKPLLSHMMERKPRASESRAELSKYEDSPFTRSGAEVIGCSLITLPAIVNFLSRPFGSLEVLSMAHLSPVD